LRQRPVALRFGSTAPAEVQQISPFIVLQFESPVHAVGHSLAGVHIGDL